MDVRPEGRVHPILSKVEPALPVEQAADLHHPHIVVGVARLKKWMSFHLLEMNQAQNAEPDERGRSSLQ